MKHIFLTGRGSFPPLCRDASAIRKARKQSLFLFLIVLLILPVCAHGQAWSGIIAPSRAIDWTNAGASSMPNRTTVCSTLNPGATAAQINAAISACPSGQVVFLNAGTYNLNTGLTLGKSNVTLRGAGPNQTFLVFSGSTDCMVGGTDICVTDGRGFNPTNPGHTANWTAGYNVGTNSITLDNTAGLAVGDILMLDQLNDIDADTGNVWICSTTDICSTQGDGEVRRPNRSQSQAVVVTAINGSTVTFASRLYMPNWRVSQQPGAWWDSVHSTSGVGIENLSLDHSASNQFSGISISGVWNWWIKNIRSINANRAAVWVYGATRGTIRDSYFYGTLNAESQSYGIETDQASDILVENNIFQHMAVPMPAGEAVTGSVYGYNFAIDDYYVAGGNTAWMQAMNYHHSAGISFHLYEGNTGPGFAADQIHGTSFFMTGFRNRWTGWDIGKNQQTDAVHIYSSNRYFNIVGNVLGTSGFHTTYECYPVSMTTAGCTAGPSLSIYMLGWSGNEQKYPTLNNDILVRATTMRWGNYDTINNAARFIPLEVPNLLSKYANAIPGSQALPPSLYLPSSPSWWVTPWGTPPWPAIGPDVTGGNLPGVSGHANAIPALLCYTNSPIDTKYGSSNVLLFNGSACYSTQTRRPAPPTNVVSTVR